MITISNSEIQLWKRCKRQWYLRYYLGMRPAEEPATGPSQLGTRVHAALEAWYGYGVHPADALASVYVHEGHRHEDALLDLNAERELAMNMVAGYLEWVAETGADATLSVVATERDVQVPLPGVDGVSIRAKLDQVVLDDSSGMLSFLDHKTASNFDRHEYLVLDPQFRFYSMIQSLARRPGNPLVYGGTVNTLRRVKRTGNSKPPYYQRDFVSYGDSELLATLRGTQHTAREILGARYALDHGTWSLAELLQSVLQPSPRVHECRWDCPFVTLCPMMDDGSDWQGALLRSGRYAQADPYSYYSDGYLPVILSDAGKLGAATQGDDH